ncbi:MAG: helix-turn-helix transcriptional regulator, partial [Clostridiales bacterium]
MSNKNNTPIAYLMDILSVTGQELADIIGVDPSIISKWKNGQRDLRLNTDNGNKVIDAFCLINKQQYTHILEDFLKGIYKQEMIDEENIKTYLHQWMSGKDLQAAPSKKNNAHAHLYTTQLTIHRGLEGKKQAILNLLKQAGSGKGYYKIFIADKGDISWLTEDKAFLEQWQEQIIKLVQKQNDIYFIHDIKNNNIQILTDLIPYYLTKKIHSHSFSNINDKENFSLYIWQKKSVAFSDGWIDNKKNIYTGIYDDHFTCQNYESKFMSILDDSPPIIDIFSFHASSLQHICQKYLLSLRKRERFFHITSLPSIVTMRSETLLQILNNYDIDKKIKHNIINIHRITSEAYKKDMFHHFNRLIHDLSCITSASKSYKIEYPELSNMTGQKISATRHQFKEHLQNLLYLLRFNDISL